MSGWKGGIGGVLLLTVIGCTHPAAPTTEPILVASFTAPIPGTRADGPTATAIPDHISVSGALNVQPCYAGAAKGTLSGSQLTLEISKGARTSEGCLTVLAYLNYEVKILLNPGVYDMRVGYGGSTPVEVLHTSITVP
jgi:hypothetical protein